MAIMVCVRSSSISHSITISRLWKRIKRVTKQEMHVMQFTGLVTFIWDIFNAPEPNISIKKTSTPKQL